MSCEICLQEATVDTVLWTCVGCSRTFHAACVGVPVQRNSLRKKEKKVDVQSYVLPCCSSCQAVITLNCEVKLLTMQQAELADSIKSHTDANLQVAADIKKLNAFGPLFDNIELQLQESVTNVNKNTSSKVANAVSALSRDIEHTAVNSVKSDELVDIKNHLTSLFNISMEATRKRIEEYVSDLTADLSRELKKICSEVENLSSITIDMASHCNEHNDSQSHSTIDALGEVKSLASSIGDDIVKEVKSLGSAMYSLESKLSNVRLPPVESPPSLMDELAKQPMNTADQGSQHNRVITEGWRWLGPKKVWRPDWTEYDIRKRRRVQQQKARVKSIKRRKANKKQWNINNNINNNSSNTNKNYKTNNNRTNSNRNNDKQNHNVPTCSYYNYNSINNNTNNNNHNSHQAGTSFLPPDKDLLAAAKVTFSRPPVENQRGIRFQRGETLNPYPVDHQLPQANSTSSHDRFSRPPMDYRPTRQFAEGETLNPYPTSDRAPRNSSASCEACTCRHSCFQRN